MKEIEKEVTMKKCLSDISVALGLLLLIVLFVIAPASARAGTLEERIEALEKKHMVDKEELARLKKEQIANREEIARLRGKQVQLGQDATAAREARPTLRYRPGSGFRIRAADKGWEIRFGSRLMLYNTFWPDENRPKGGAAQGAIQVRRFRPYTTFLWKDFYELKFQVDTDNGGSGTGGNLTAFDAEMVLHFEKLHPWLPFLHVGSSPSLRLNPQDTNCSSKRCGRSERSLLNEGVGITTGSVDRGLVLGWKKFPLGGPAQVSFFNFAFGMDRTDAFARLRNAGVENDGKSFGIGIGIKPFAKSKNKWLKGMEVSFGGHFQKFSEDPEGGYNIRANQTRALRVELIRTAGREGLAQYYTPGFGWKYGPYQLRFAGQFENSHRDLGALRGEDGGLIKGRGFRISHELFLWSPKGGFLTGSYKKGGLMISPMYTRADVDGGSAARMSNCGGCKSAHAVNTGIALWYYVPGDVFNFGIVWDHYRVSNANRDVARRIEGSAAQRAAGGGSENFNTLTLITRFHW